MSTSGGGYAPPVGLFDMFKKKPSATLATVFETHVARSLEKLVAMRERFPTQDVTDVKRLEGVLTLDGTRLPIQFIGASTKAEGMWKWADDDDANFVSPRCLVASKRVLALGKTLGIRELGEPSPGQVHVDVTTLIAMGVGELGGRVLLPLDTAMFCFGLEAGAVPVPRPDAMRMSRVMGQVVRMLGALTFDPIAAFRHYATSHGMNLRDVPGGIEADVAPHQTCGAVVERAEPELARALDPGVVGYSFPVSLDGTRA